MSYTRSANVFVMGPAGVGKTELVKGFIDFDAAFSDEYVATFGVTFNNKCKTLKDSGLDINVLDAGGGSQRFIEGYSSYLEDAHVVLCCFDANSEASLNEAIAMLKTAFQNVANRPYVVFVGTKFDTCSGAPEINQDHITQEIAKLKTAIPRMDFHPRYEYTSAKTRGSDKDLKTGMKVFFNVTIPGLCHQALQKKEVGQPGSPRSNNQGQMFIPENDADSTETSHETFFQRHPNVRMGLAVAALVIGLAAIAVATVATCGVAGLLGAAAASIAATLTFGASLTTVGAVAGGVGLFGGLGVAAGSYLMHTRPRVEKVEVVQVHGSPFGGEKDKAAFGEALGDLKFAIKNNGAVRLFTGAMNRAGECLPFRGRSFSSSYGLDD